MGRHNSGTVRGGPQENLYIAANAITLLRTGVAVVLFTAREETYPRVANLLPYARTTVDEGDTPMRPTFLILLIIAMLSFWLPVPSQESPTAKVWPVDYDAITTIEALPPRTSVEPLHLTAATASWSDGAAAILAAPAS